MTRVWKRRGLYRAGAWNVVGGLSMAWGLGYILAARLPAARAPGLVAGGAGRLAYFGACPALDGGQGRPALLASGVLDVVFAGFFGCVLWPARSGPPA